LFEILFSKTDHSGSIFVLRLCWPGKALQCIFTLLKPRLNTNGCVYGQTVILKNCTIVRKQQLDHRTHLVNYIVHTVTSGNLTIQTSRIQRYCCRNHHRSTSMFPSWNQGFRITGFFGCSPNINTAQCWEQCEV
jgi:hypothetical protein